MIITLSRRNPTKQKKLHHVKEIATWDKLGRVETSWDKLGRVGNQRNYRILTLKKTSPERKKERRKKKNIGYRVASNERRLKKFIGN